MAPAMAGIGLDAGWVLVYTATVMMVLRFCIGPIERRLNPLGVLFASALFAAAGLFALSRAGGVWILVAWVIAVRQALDYESTFLIPVYAKA